MTACISSLLSTRALLQLCHQCPCCCRVVSEWSFKKDGVDAAMKDLANETRGAQTDDRDTFLGIGQKRCCCYTY